jgi:phage-related minor tail protein
MSTKKAQLELSANSAPAEQAFDRVEKAGRRMGDSVAKEGDKAGKALEGVGDGAEVAAKKTERAYGRMESEIRRLTAAAKAQAEGTGKAGEIINKAILQGLDPSRFDASLKALRDLEAQQTKTGISAKQTVAALRGVPAQFTDIAVSLQGGQAPLTVFLQQGGQLKDMFGGAGDAARALGGYVVSLVNPFTVAAAAAGALAIAYHQGSKEADEFRKALVTTGNAAGTSTNQLAAMAASMDQSFGTTTGKAAEVLAQLAATGQVGRASLEDFGNTAIQAEKAFGTATADIAKNFADLGKDPVGASAKLNESMNYLTASTYKQIQAAMDLGQESKAAALAQDAYNSALKGRSAEMLASMGYIERGWGGIKSAAKEAWDAMLGVGRPTTAASQIAEVQKNLAASIEKRSKVSNDSAFAPDLDKEIAKLKEELGYLGEIDRMQKRAGDSAAERVAKEQAGIQAQKDGLKYLSQEQKMRNDIAQQTATMRKAGMDEAAIQERIAQIKASYDKKGSGGSRAKEISEYEKLNARIGEFAALQTAALEADGKLTEGQRLAVRVKQDMIAAGAKLSASDKERLQTALNAALATEQRLDAEKDLAKFMDESVKLQAKAADQSDKAIDALKKQAAAEREATASIGLSKDAIAELTVAKYEDSAASKERMADMMAEAGEPELLVQKYRAEAAALRDLAKAKRERGSAEAASEAEKIAAKAASEAEKIAAKAASEAEKIAQRAADKAAADWQRAADKIENSITDALMRGFESGKDFAQNLRDTLVNMFKTMVLRPIIAGAVSLTMGAGASATGTGPASADIFGATNNAYTAYSTGSSAFLIGSQMAAGTMSAANAAGTIFGNTAAVAYGDGLSALLATNGAYGTAAGTGSSMMAGAAQAGPYVLAAVGVLNALGAFRSNKIVGGGIAGTLGGGDLEAYALNRKGGSLLDGPTYTAISLGQTDQTKAINDAFLALRTGTAQMAKDLGLATAQIDAFTMSVGDVKVHPDIDKLGLVLDGLTDQQKLAKIEEVLQKSGNAMAELVLGAGATSQQLAQLYASVMQQRAGLELQLLQAQNNVTEIRKRERDALHESNRAIYDQIKAIEDQKIANEAATKASEAARAEQATAAAERARATDLALTALQKSISAEQSAVQKIVDRSKASIDALGSIMDMLSGHLTGLRRQVVMDLEVASANAGIDASLALLKAGGVIPSQAVLSDQINLVRQSIDDQNYSTRAEAEYARLELVNRLKALRDHAGEQLSQAEQDHQTQLKQLDSLNELLQAQQNQLDVMRGVDISVQSVTAAVAALQAAMLAERTGTAATGTGTGAGPVVGPGPMVGPGPVVGPGPMAGAGLGSNIYADKDFAYAAMKKLEADIEYARSVGVYGGNYELQYQQLNAQLGLTPRFATGGAFTNGVVHRPTAFSLGQMGEAGPEAIMPLSNVGGSLGVRAQMPGTQDMLQALQALQALMQRLQTASESGALTSQEHLHLMRRLTRDGRAMPVAPSPNDPLTVEMAP